MCNCTGKVEEYLFLSKNVAAPTDVGAIGSGNPRALKRKSAFIGPVRRAAQPGEASVHGRTADLGLFLPAIAAGAGGELADGLIEAAVEAWRPYLRQDSGDSKRVHVDGNAAMASRSSFSIGRHLPLVIIAGVLERLMQKLGLLRLYGCRTRHDPCHDEMCDEARMF